MSTSRGLVYLSSSWKNRDRVRAIALKLRAIGFDVYDFTDKTSRGEEELPPERFPDPFDPSKHVYHEYLRAEPLWKVGVDGNRRAIEACSFVVLMLPCGADAHADAYYGLGKGKLLVVCGQPRAGERTPTHLWDGISIVDSDDDAVRALDSVSAAILVRFDPPQCTGTLVHHEYESPCPVHDVVALPPASPLGLEIGRDVVARNGRRARSRGRVADHTADGLRWIVVFPDDDRVAYDGRDLGVLPRAKLLSSSAPSNPSQDQNRNGDST